MDDKGKGAATNDAQEKGANREIITDESHRVQRIPQGWKLPFWEPPRSKTQAIARLKTSMQQFARHAYENLFKWGGDLIALQNSPSVKHGDWLDCLAELGMEARTAQNWMRFHRECLEFKRIVVPHWIRNRKPKTKHETVSLFSDGPESEEVKEEKPKHEPGASKEWNATDCARSLLNRYERLVMGRTEEERQEVLTIFNELAQDANRELSESRRIMREGGGRFVE